MNKNIYLKGICYSTSGIYLPDEQRYSLNEILDNGEIVSARLLGSKKPNGFSGLDYISLCDYEKRDLVNGGIKNYNAFYQYIVHSLSLAFPKEKLDAIVPKLIASLYKNKHRDSIMESFGMVEERYSDLPDEVQVKDIITLDDMCGITFPTKSFINLLTFRSKKTKIR